MFFFVIQVLAGSAADVNMEIPVLVQSLKSSILSSTSFQMSDPLLESGECCCIFPGPCVTDV